MPPKASEESRALPSYDFYVAILKFVFMHGRGSVSAALRESKIDIMHELFRVGIDLNTRSKESGDYESDYPLVETIKIGKLEFVEALLEAKANPNVFSKDGVSAASLAVRYKHVAVLRALIAAGAPVDAQNNNDSGDTPLIESSRNGRLDCAVELIQAKANVNQTNKHGYTPLIESSWNGYLECAVELIQAKANVNHKNKWGETALMVASSKGHLEIVEALLAAKADTNFQDKSGSTALNLLASSVKKNITESKMIMRALIDAGADVNLPDNENRTPVFRASSGRDPCVEFVQLLIDAKCCVLTPDENGETPIYAAASTNIDVEIIRALLKANANAQTPNKNGLTPLHIVALNRHDEAIKVLVMEGQAQLRVLDNVKPFAVILVDFFRQKGERPLEYARPGSSTHALLTEMELTGADEHVLIKSATKRFRPLVLDE